MIKNVIKSIVEHFPALALFYRNTRDLLDQRHLPRTTPWGFSFAGHDAMAAGSFEPEETAIVNKLLADVDVLVNIGANVGYYCCHALSIGKSVVAVEPNARNLHYLLKNIKNNGWENQAEVFPVATGSAADILQMWGGDGRFPSQRLGSDSRELCDAGPDPKSGPHTGRHPARQASADSGGY